jgi:hypothetical protein
MKNSILSVLLFLFAAASFAQTATNFTAKDCAGLTHDLFTELDAGKVVVLCWVMPCGSCVPASLTTNNVVKSYQETNPGTVLFYLVDDLANTPCASLTSWGNSNHLSPTATFSDISINMLDYGNAGMPKIAVIGGASHHVFMIADNVVDPTELQNSINAALITSGVSQETKNASWANVFPNPADDQLLLTINSPKILPLKAEIFNLDGKSLGIVFDGSPQSGNFNIDVNLSGYQPGIYFIRLGDGERTSTIKFTVKH